MSDARAQQTVRSWETRSPEETRRLGTALAAELVPDRALLLTGDLAAGKTVLAQGIAAALGIDPEEVQSPTYTLVREHRGDRGRLLHLDLYRLEREQTAGVGIEELLLEPAVKVIEWAERLPLRVPGALAIHVVRLDGDARRIEEREA